VYDYTTVAMTNDCTTVRQYDYDNKYDETTVRRQLYDYYTMSIRLYDCAAAAL